jgi:hypothetical protein
MACALADRIGRLLPQNIRNRGRLNALPPTQERCEELLALTGWDRYVMAQVIEEMTEAPPFTLQLDYDARQAQRHLATWALERFATPQALLEAATVYQKALAARPGDFVLHNNFAYLEERRGDHESAVEHWNFIRARFPPDGLRGLPRNEADPSR